MWRWLLGGLGGLVGMMLKHAGEDPPPMTSEQSTQLETYIRQLAELKQKMEQK